MYLRTALWWLWTLLCTMGAAQAHEATELYIPVGQSPGISGTLTDVGEVEAVDPQARTLTVGSRTVEVTDETKIYVDRSLLKRRSTTGTFADLGAGLKVEILYVEPGRRQSARWVKVQLAP